MAQEFKMHTETIELPSKGWFYPEDNPLSKGVIDLYYMTAKHEDILTSRNLITKGIVVEKLLEELIATPGVKLDDLLLCDKSAIMIAARILGYGKEYPISVDCPSCNEKINHSVDLQELEDKPCPYFVTEYKGKNEFPFTLPISKVEVLFKYLTQSDDRSIRAEVDGVKKAFKSDVSREASTRIRKSIVAVNGSSDGETIRKFIDSLLARDAAALREHIRSTLPDVDLNVTVTCDNCGYEGRVEMPINLNFFWPDAGV